MSCNRRGKGRPTSLKKVINVIPFQDERLSYKARGILAYLFSQKKDWKGQVYNIEANSDNDGMTAIKSGMKELVDLGYAELEPFPRKEGKFQGWYYQFYDIPLIKNAIHTAKPINTNPNEPKWPDKSYYTPWLDNADN